MTCNMKKQDVAKKMVSQHEQTKKNNSLMIRIDRKRERNRIANESKQKGKMSLNSVGKNEGENMMMGKNNTQRA